MSATNLQTATHTNQAGASRLRRLGRSKVTWFILIALAAISIWASIDLYAPVQTDIRQFDPDEVARLDTAMWRSYYSRQRFLLFRQLAELMRTQYRLPFLRSNLVAYRAGKAAFVFKDGHSRADYEKALPDLLSFYREVRKVSNVPFNTERAARLELEWWIIHRQRADHQPGDLERALAELAAEVYQAPVESMMEHARLRAEAMKIRDETAEAGGVTEEDWKRIDELLHDSWRSLSRAVKR